MKKIVVVLLICLAFMALLGGQAGASTDIDTTVNTGPVQIDPTVQASVARSQPGDMLPVILTLRQQADLSKVHGANPAARQKAVIQALQATANATQGRLTSLLNSYHNQGSVNSFTSLWVFNGFSVTATSEVIASLAQDADVFAITPDDIRIVPALGRAEPNIALVDAPALWSQGYTGQGVVVASMDSGVDVSHPDLSSRWRGGSNSWFDPYDQHSTPADVSGHGTWTTGIMVGGDAGGTSIGVAPGAQWIAVKIFNDQGGSTATAIHQGFQWLLDPDGDPNTADAPQAVNNSWTYANPGCYLDFEPDLESLRAAGILPVFAAGNGGPYSNSSYSPSNNPAAFAVGAVDNNNQIYAYSSRGPSTCGGSTGPFPEIVAPGVNILTTGLYGTYNTDSGTSFAAPHVAGGLALLLSAYPNLDAGMQEQALIQSAVDLGASGPDDVFGYGRLDLLSALNWASTAPTPTPTPTASPSPMPTATATALPNVNLALNQPVAVSSFQDSAHSGLTAVDGDLGSQWQTEKVRGKNKSTSEWIEVDLGTPQDISQVTLDWGAYYATDYSIQVSTDDSVWATVHSTSSGNGGHETIAFNVTQARYIRLYSSAWSDSSFRDWLNEFEVYAASTAQAPAPTSTPTALPTSTPTPSPTSTPQTGNSIHVGDLDDISTSNGSHWNAVVKILVHDATETPLQGVLVSGDWSSEVCTTDADGTCSLSQQNLKNNVGSVTFTIADPSDLSFVWPYKATLNHDPDGDSNGTSITLLKP
jgi:serine protease AprX